MSKAVLLSVSPSHCFGVLSGGISILIRKSRPKLDVPFKGYIYCTKPKVYLRDVSLYADELYRLPSGEVKFGSSIELARYPDQWNKENFLSGKVIGEFTCSRILPIMIEYSDVNSAVANHEFPYTGMSDKEIMDYLGSGKYGYGLCVTNLVFYDKPKELSEFKGRKLVWRGNNHIHAYETITRPPKSWCYVEDLESAAP